MLAPSAHARVSFLEGFSIDEQKQALLRISRYLLRGSSGEMRESIYKSLIEISLFTSDDPIKLISEIIDDVTYTAIALLIAIVLIIVLAVIAKKKWR